MSNDPRSIWQEQPTEPRPMSMGEIIQRTEGLRQQNKRALLRARIIPVVLLTAVYPAAMLPDPRVRLLFAATVAWSAVGIFVRRTRVPAAAEAATGIESYRAELERRQMLIGRNLAWSAAPTVLVQISLIAALLTLAGPSSGAARKILPFLALSMVWFVGLVAMQFRDRHALQTEIDNLNSLECGERYPEPNGHPRLPSP